MKLLRKMWADDCGSVLAAEYLIVGTVAIAGATLALDSARRAVNDQAQQFAASVTAINQSYSAPAQRGCAASKAGSAYIAPPVNSCP